MVLTPRNRCHIAEPYVCTLYMENLKLLFFISAMHQKKKILKLFCEIQINKYLLFTNKYFDKI